MNRTGVFWWEVDDDCSGDGSIGRLAHDLGRVWEDVEDIFDPDDNRSATRCTATVSIDNYPRAPRGAIMADFQFAVTDDTHHLTVTFEWSDAHGNPVTDESKIPASPAAVFAVSDTAACAVDPSSGALTPTGTIVSGISGTVTNADGSALSDPAGVITFDVIPVLFDLTAGPATNAKATVAVV